MYSWKQQTQNAECTTRIICTKTEFYCYFLSFMTFQTKRLKSDSKATRLTRLNQLCYHVGDFTSSSLGPLGTPSSC